MEGKVNNGSQEPLTAAEPLYPEKSLAEDGT